VDKQEAPEVGRRIRALREEQGLSLRALAGRSGLSQNAISLIERGENSPTVASLHALAQALGTPITDFFRDGQQAQVAFITPQTRLRVEIDEVTLESLGIGLRNQRLEPFLVTVPPGARSSARPLSHAGEEFVYCLGGKVAYTVGEETYWLQTGCSLLFDAALPHAFANEGQHPAELLLVLCSTSGGALAARWHLGTGAES
jgi:transcriptional regulator with XRE-family HTH domain